ncbi:MAG: hypothetical protein NTZ32_15725 [Planctomycetales bacterium]|nr:hypothetical protein [Planctomycetales bacterium]
MPNPAQFGGVSWRVPFLKTIPLYLAWRLEYASRGCVGLTRGRRDHHSGYPLLSKAVSRRRRLQE